MRSAKVVACIFGMLGVCVGAVRVSAQGQETGQGKRIVIAASTGLDGKGGGLRDARIAGEGSKSGAVETKVDGERGTVDYDLRGLSGMPGRIDAQAHITCN